MKAYYSLDLLKIIIQQNDKTKIDIRPKRSTLEVVRVYQNDGKLLSYREANDFILKGLLLLEEKHFYKSQVQWETVVVDIYGLNYDGKPWFIKFFIEDGTLLEISFHPPQAEFTTLGGIKINKGE